MSSSSSSSSLSSSSFLSITGNTVTNERNHSQSSESSSQDRLSDFAAASILSTIHLSPSSPINSTSKNQGTKRKQEDSSSSSCPVAKMITIAKQSIPSSASTNSAFMVELAKEICNGQENLFRSIIEKEDKEIAEILKYEMLLDVDGVEESATIFSLMVRYCSVDLLEKTITLCTTDEIYQLTRRTEENAGKNLLHKLFTELLDSCEEKASILLTKVGVGLAKMLLKERNDVVELTPLYLLYCSKFEEIDQEVDSNTVSLLSSLLILLLTDSKFEENFPEDLVLFLDRIPSKQCYKIWEKVFDECEHLEKILHEQEFLFSKLILCYDCPITLFEDQFPRNTFQEFVTGIQDLSVISKKNKGLEILEDLLLAVPTELAKKVLFVIHPPSDQLIIKRLLLDENNELNDNYGDMLAEKFPDILLDWLSFISPLSRVPEISYLSTSILFPLLARFAYRAPNHLEGFCNLLHTIFVDKRSLVESLFDTRNQGLPNISTLFELSELMTMKSFVQFIKIQNYQDGTLLSKAIKQIHMETPEILEYGNSTSQEFISDKLQQVFVKDPIKLALLVWNSNLDLITNLITAQSSKTTVSPNYFDCLSNFVPRNYCSSVYPLAFALIYSDRTISRIWNPSSIEYIVATLRHKIAYNDLLHFIANGEFVPRELMSKAFSDLNLPPEEVRKHRTVIKNMLLQYGPNTTEETFDTPLEYFVSSRNIKILELLCKGFGERQFGEMLRHQSENLSSAFQKIIIPSLAEEGVSHSDFMTNVLRLSPRVFFKSLQKPYPTFVNKKYTLEHPMLKLIGNISDGHHPNYEMFLKALRFYDGKLSKGKIISNLFKSQTVENSLMGDDPVSIIGVIISQNKQFVLQWLTSTTRESSNLVKVLGSIDQRGNNPLYYAVACRQWKQAIILLCGIRIVNQLIPLTSKCSFNNVHELHSKTTMEVVDRWLFLLETDPKKYAKQMAIHLLSLYLTFSADNCRNLAENLPMHAARPYGQCNESDRFVSPFELVVSKLHDKLDSEMADLFFEELFAQCPQMFVNIDTSQLTPAIISDGKISSLEQKKSIWIHQDQQLRIEVAKELLKNKKPEAIHFYRQVLTAKYNLRFDGKDNPVSATPKENLTLIHTEVLKQYRYFYNVNQVLKKLLSLTHIHAQEQINKELGAIAQIYDPRSEDTTKLVPKYFKGSKLKPLYLALLLMREGLLVPIPSRIAGIPGTLFQRMMSKGKAR